jgi:hypothetical protein
VQPETYIRGNKNKKKIKQADFPAEAPESNSNKCETGNAEHSMHDLSSESAKECSVTESESYYRAKNDGSANQAKKHSGTRCSKRRIISSRFPDARPSMKIAREEIRLPSPFLVSTEMAERSFRRPPSM